MPDHAHRLIRQLIPDVGFHQNHYAHTLDQVVPDASLWLDLGAGTQLHDGFGVPTPQQLAARAQRLIGVDPVTAHLHTNPCLTEAVGAVGDALPFASASFDVVTANMVVEHLEHPATVFAEVARVLRPRGTFIFVTPNLDHPFIRAASLLLTQHQRRDTAVRVEGRDADHVFPTFYRANTPRQIRALARDTGFRDAQVIVHRNLPFFRRPVPLVVMECLMIRMTGLRPLQRFGADLVAVLRR